MSALRKDYTQSVLLSSLAAGADQLCADIGLSLGYELICPLPFAKVRNDFAGNDLEKFDALMSKAAQTVLVSTNQNADQAYLLAGQYIVEHCDVLLAIWDGSAQSSICGTQAVVKYAKEKGKRTIIIMPGS